MADRFTYSRRDLTVEIASDDYFFPVYRIGPNGSGRVVATINRRRRDAIAKGATAWSFYPAGGGIETGCETVRDCLIAIAESLAVPARRGRDLGEQANAHCRGWLVAMTARNDFVEIARQCEDDLALLMSDDRLSRDTRAKLMTARRVAMNVEMAKATVFLMERARRL